MKNTIKELINELIRNDSSLKGKEAELETILSKMAEIRPSAEPDPEFRARLKDELLRKLSSDVSRKKGLVFWLMQKRIRILIGSGAVICLIAVTIITNPIAQMTMKNAPQQAAPQIQQIITQTQANGNTVAAGTVSPMKAKTDLQHPPADDISIETKELGPVSEEAAKTDYKVVLADEEISQDKMSDIVKSESAVKVEAESKQLQEPADKNSLLAKYDKKSKDSMNAGLELEKPSIMPAPQIYSYNDVKDGLSAGKLPAPSYYVKADIMIESFDYILPAGSDKTQPLYTEIAPCSWDSRYALLVILLPGEIAKTCNYPPEVQTVAGETVATKWLKLTQALAGSRPQAVFGLIPVSVYKTAMTAQNLQVKIRYFDQSAGKTQAIKQLLFYPADASKTTSLFRFISSVSEWALLLNNPGDVPQGSFADTLSLAEGAQGAVPDSQWKDFIEVLKLTIKAQ
ncbi:MAG: hypothetical protein A2014_01915 [Spirochaetes bacterium GWF1_49_6]|nr:MAG: hypothetical protein A2014_01915 [Spirochaetes bacterium GWF1_49_6]